MGLIIKLAISLIIFVFQKTFKSWNRKYRERTTARYTYLEHTLSNKQGQTIYHILAIPFKSSLYFNIYPENAGSRWTKKWGLAYEFQTGDVPFDEEYYLAIDHYYMIKLLREEKKMRDLIRQLFRPVEGGSKLIKVLEVFSDGEVLGIKFNTFHLSENLIYKLYEFKNSLEDMLKQSGQRFIDHFFSKQMIVDGIVLSLVAYAFSSLLEYYLVTRYLYADPKIMTSGLCLSVIVFTALFLLYKKYMSGSARSYVTFWWNLFASAVSLTVVCAQVLLEINIHFDRSEIKNYRAVVTSTEVRSKYNRRGRRIGENCFLNLQYSAKHFPYRMQVPNKEFLTSVAGEEVVVEYKDGYLGYPYLVSVDGLKL